MTNRPSRTTETTRSSTAQSPTDDLEQAMGFAKRMLRRHLEEQLLEGVRFAYFLGYDAWDGSLVYEGLVHDSPEEQLIRCVQRSFLQDDRVRSKFQESVDSEHRDLLGMAGQSFADGQCRYSCDLSIEDLYTSEYKEYDLFLGLRCCAFIPIPPGEEHGARPRDPYPGGVIVLANPDPYGLIPRLQVPLRDVVKQKKQQYFTLSRNPDPLFLRSLDELDRQLGKELHKWVTASPHVNDFTHCVCNIRRQQNRRRVAGRRYFEPHLPKAIATALKYTLPERPLQTLTNQAVAGICRAIRENLPGTFGEGSLMLTKDAIENYVHEQEIEIPPNLSKDQYSSCVDEALALMHKLWLFAAKNDPSVNGLEPSPLLRAQGPLFVQTSIIDHVIDDIREGLKEPEEIAFDELVRMAPVSSYVRQLRLFEPILLSTRKYRLHLVHMFQVYMVGAAILTSAWDLIVKLRRYLSFEGWWGNEADLPTSPADKHRTRQERAAQLLDAWMITACSHDIAYPIQECGNWLRSFFSFYINPQVVEGMPLGVLGTLNLLQNRWFSRYVEELVQQLVEDGDGRQRVWLRRKLIERLSDTSAHAPDHAVLSALLLRDELDKVVHTKASDDADWEKWLPKDSYCIPILRKFSELHKNAPDAYERVTGKISTAIACHSAYWWKTVSKRRSRDLDKGWNGLWNAQVEDELEVLARRFTIHLNKHPLAYILALADMLQEFGRPRLGETGELETSESSLFVRSITSPDKDATTHIVFGHSAASYSDQFEELDHAIIAAAFKRAVQLWQRAKVSPDLIQVRRLRVPVWPEDGSCGEMKDRAKAEGDWTRGLVEEVSEDGRTRVLMADYIHDIVRKLDEMWMFSETFVASVKHRRLPQGPRQRVERDRGWRFVIEFEPLRKIDQLRPFSEWTLEATDRCWGRYRELTLLDSHYCVWAEAYKSQAGRRLWSGAPMPPVSRFVEHIAKASATSVLDAGCGDGRHLGVLFDKRIPLVVGCDFSAEALSLCREAFRARHVGSRSKLLTIRGALERMDFFPPDTFDVVLCTDVLVHNTFFVSVDILRQISRVLKPGGRALVNVCTHQEPVRAEKYMKPFGPLSAWYRPPSGEEYYFEFYTEAKLKMLLAEAGITTYQIERQRWKEPPHPGYRDYAHRHDGWFVTVTKQNGGGEVC